MPVPKFADENRLIFLFHKFPSTNSSNLPGVSSCHLIGPMNVATVIVKSVESSNSKYLVVSEACGGASIVLVTPETPAHHSDILPAHLKTQGYKGLEVSQNHNF